MPTLHRRSGVPFGVLEMRAYHEAGHAVIALLEGFSVTRITITRRGRIGGACEFRFAVPAGRPGPATARRLARAAVAVALAGSVAQDLAALARGYVALDPRTGEPFPVFAAGAEDDARVAMRFAARLVRGLDRKRALMRRARRRVERLLAEPVAWAAVEALARLLLRERTLSGDQALCTVGRAVGRAGRRPPPAPSRGGSRGSASKSGAAARAPPDHGRRGRRRGGARAAGQA